MITTLDLFNDINVLAELELKGCAHGRKHNTSPSKPCHEHDALPASVRPTVQVKLLQDPVDWRAAWEAPKIRLQTR